MDNWPAGRYMNDSIVDVRLKMGKIQTRTTILNMVVIEQESSPLRSKLACEIGVHMTYVPANGSILIPPEFEMTTVLGQDAATVSTTAVPFQSTNRVSRS